MATHIKESGSVPQPLENPVSAQHPEDNASLEQCHKAGYERIPASEEFDDLLAAQVIDADSSNASSETKFWHR